MKRRYFAPTFFSWLLAVLCMGTAPRGSSWEREIVFRRSVPFFMYCKWMQHSTHSLARFSILSLLSRSSIRALKGGGGGGALSFFSAKAWSTVPEMVTTQFPKSIKRTVRFLCECQCVCVCGWVCVLFFEEWYSQQHRPLQEGLGLPGIQQVPVLGRKV